MFAGVALTSVSHFRTTRGAGIEMADFRLLTDNAKSPPTRGQYDENAKPPRRWRGGFVSDDQIFVTILMPGPMVDAVTQDLMYWPFAAAGLALMIAPMSAS